MQEEYDQAVLLVEKLDIAKAMRRCNSSHEI